MVTFTRLVVTHLGRALIPGKTTETDLKRQKSVGMGLFSLATFRKPFLVPSVRQRTFFPVFSAVLKRFVSLLRFRRFLDTVTYLSVFYIGFGEMQGAPPTPFEKPG